jgi:tRNA-binding protein
MFVLHIDFSPLGIKATSAMITDLYIPETLVGRQVVAVTGFPVKHIAGVRSEVLFLAVVSDDGSVLLTPDRVVNNGSLVR